jgi:hypothetical protein
MSKLDFRLGPCSYNNTVKTNTHMKERNLLVSYAKQLHKKQLKVVQYCSAMKRRPSQMTANARNFDLLSSEKFMSIKQLVFFWQFFFKSGLY